jgi:hypothetical protein
MAAVSILTRKFNAYYAKRPGKDVQESLLIEPA